ncbi:MAG TPA: 2-octaprenyl-3-methyl-6-methoxy-1,4-benzoquinol hydroxylase [Porticoccaceae bacterium]|nr:2-octaprenyl-3-methyl-6-methoxy-1,4-benzoquinol hydroxylase [Porticoccaceae bacterium]
MSSRGHQEVDVIIVGAGMVGALCAYLLARMQPTLDIALIESSGYHDVQDGDFGSGVAAVNESSRRLFESCGLWQAILAERCCEYTRMDVWDADGTGRVIFDCAEFNRPNLGYIVEHCILKGVIMRAVSETNNVTLHCPETVVDYTYCDDLSGIEVELGSGERLRTRLLIGADGTRSNVRRDFALATREWAYEQSSLTAVVETEWAHQSSARQIFMPTGPLALLPLPEREGRYYCSLVWSQDTQVANELMALDDAVFCEQLARASERSLGAILATGKRSLVPLVQRHAIDYVTDRVALIGDAAHSIHPLAGQGANLGFGDVRVLAEEINRAFKLGSDFGDMAVLKRYQRRRKPENLSMMSSVELIKRLFSTSHLPIRLLRNVGMRKFDQVPALKRYAVKRAMGF